MDHTAVLIAPTACGQAARAERPPQAAPPRCRLRGGDTPRGGKPGATGHAGRARWLGAGTCAAHPAWLVTIVFFVCQLFGCLSPLPLPKAYASEIITFRNGGTATREDDGSITGTCYSTAVWKGLGTDYLLTMPDGQTIAAHCIDFGYVDPADDEYAFTATPVGDGSYNVHVHSDGAPYYQRPENPRIPSAGALVQRLESDNPWTPEIRLTGHLTLLKTSALPDLTDGNAAYSLEGARFSVWADEACTQRAGDDLVTNAEGTTNTIDIDEGTYWVREENAPDGYLSDGVLHMVTVASGQTTVLEVANTPLYQQIGLVAVKRDAETGSIPQGAGALAGAEFTVYFHAGLLSGPALGQATRTWVLRSDAQGNVMLDAAHFVSGDDFYTDAAGNVVLPRGAVSVRETKAPTGYWLEDQKPTTGVGYVAPMRTMRITGTNTYNAPTIYEDVRRAGLSLQKGDAQTGTTAQGDASFGGVGFEVVSRNERTVIVNGQPYGAGEVVATLTTNAQGTASTSADLLPVGTYEVREVSTNESMRQTAPAQTITLKDYNAGKVVALLSRFSNEVVRGGVRVAKSDADLGAGQAQGDATLAGVRFSITLDSAQSVVVGGSTYRKGQVVATITTNEAGIAQTQDTALPYGTYTVREAGAPAGYLREAGWSQTFSVREQGVVVDLTGNPCPDQIKRGGVRLGKVDAERNAHLAQGDATLEGAVFAVTLDSAQPVVVGGATYAQGQVVLTLRSDATGRLASGNRDLPYGTYTVREVAAPEGYLLNEGFSRQFSVRDDGVVVDLGNGACADQVARGALAVGKVSRETRLHRAQGEATLRGAQFAVTLDSTQPVLVGDALHEKGEVVCVLTTDENGYARTEDRALPYGTYTVREIEAPQGYLLNDAWSRTVCVRSDGALYDLYDEESSVNDQVMRGGFHFNKADGETMERMALVAFRVTSATTGESHVLVADENGIVDTEDAAHTAQTNANDGAVDAEGTVHDDLLNPAAGVWFSGHADLTVPPDDAKPALPYDVYTVDELASLANEGRELVSFTVRIHRDGARVDMGTVDDRTNTTPQPSIGTTLTYDETAHLAPATGRVVLTDAVSYVNLQVGTEYTLEGSLVFADDGAPVADGEGQPVVAAASFVPVVPSGQVSVAFELDGGSLAGRDVVAFERLVCNGAEVASHADLADEGQTVSFARLGTTLADADGNHEVLADGDTVTLVDTVHYENLIPHRSYEVVGTLMDKATGKELVGATGQAVRGTTTFVPDERNGSVTVTFVLDRDTAQGAAVVAFEQLRRGGVTVAAHEDLDDEGQSVTIPQVRTELSDARGHHAVTADETVELVDTVAYVGLQAGERYEVRGTLVDKDTGEPLHDADGNELQATASFEAEQADGHAEVAFSVDGALLAGRTVVAFEELAHDGRTVAIHADLADEAQTIYVATVSTTLASDADTHEVAAQETARLTDAVSYRGVRPGIPHTVVGTLVDRETGKALDVEGATAEQEFVPTATSGSVDVTFELDAQTLAGTTLVAFESLREGTGEGAREVASHQDLGAVSQTAWVPRIATTATDATDGDKQLAREGIAKVRDVVTYEGLTADAAYIMCGTLYDKETGAPLASADGTALTQQVTFTPTEADGTVELTFAFDVTLAHGHDIVVFESCLRDGVEVATHADLQDESQTVTIEPERETPVKEPPAKDKPDEPVKTPAEDKPTEKGEEKPEDEGKAEDKPSEPERPGKTPATGDASTLVWPFAVAGVVLLAARRRLR